MELGSDLFVRSLGYGVLVIGAPDAASASAAAAQVGHVLETWASDREDRIAERETFVAVVDGGHATSKWEASIVADEEVAKAVRSAARSTPPGSILRSRLGLVDAACAHILKGSYGAPLRP